MLFHFLFFAFASSITSSIIKLTTTVSAYQYDKFHPTLYYPNEGVDYAIYLNTFLSHTILGCTFHILNSSKRNSSFHQDDYYCHLYDTSIRFKDIVLSNISVYYANASAWSRDMGIALGYHSDNESFSIVNLLYKRNKIEKNQFAFNTKEKEGNWLIGGIPNEEHMYSKYKGVIKVNESLPTWGFKLKEILYKNEKHEMNLDTIVHSGMHNLIISDDVFEIMLHKVFKPDLIAKQCHTETTEDYGVNFDMAYMSCSQLSHNEQIKFVFENVIITLNESDLFDIFKTSRFRGNGKPNLFANFSGVLLGKEFIELFDYIIFDYTNKQVELYSNSTMITLTEREKHQLSVKMFFGVNIILCLFNIVILLYKQ